MSDEEQMEHQFILDDLAKAQKRAEKAKFLEAKVELANETYPLLHSAFEHVFDRLQRMEATVDALIDETDSLIQADLAQQILATLTLAKSLAGEVGSLPPGSLDETTLKRLQNSASALMAGCDITMEAVSEHSLEGGDEDEAEEEEESQS